jgi:hypothetical protein
MSDPLDEALRLQAMAMQKMARGRQGAAPEMQRPRGADALAAMEEAIQPGAIQPGQFATGGAVDPDSVLGDVGRSFGSGVVRGTAAVVDTPGQVMEAGNVALAGMLGAGQETQDAVRRATQFMPGNSRGSAGILADAALPGARDYQPQTAAGEYAQTVGEFTPGGVMGRGGMVMNAVIPGIASEAAGQATEGTALEPYARVIGAVAAPLAIQGVSAGFRRLFEASQQRPTIENLRATKTAAYRAVDQADEVFDGPTMQTLAQRARAAADDGTYVEGVDTGIDAALRILERRAGQDTSFSQLDRIRQNLWTRYQSNKNQTVILDIIDAIDDVVAARPETSGLVAAARLANSRFKKAELLDNALRRATDQTAATGSGGNILNKYRQAVTSIINNPRQARWFASDEISVMRDFVRGSTSENVLRRAGKLAPTGNGLMLALNLGAAAVNPMMLGATAGATLAKGVADGMATRNADALIGMVAGQMPQRAAPGFNALVPMGNALAIEAGR